MSIYTRTGDDGTTGLQGGKRVPKSNTRIRAYGAVDEVNAKIGIVISNNPDEDIKKNLLRIQNELFTLGADLSNPDLVDNKNRVTHEMVENLENEIDSFEEQLDPLTNFVLPGGHPVASLIHEVRTVARRAETELVALDREEKINTECKKYLNRLSDLLFVISRTINKRNGIEDVIWKP